MTEANFVDYVKLNLKSGKGGKGSVPYTAKNTSPKVGPTVGMEVEVDTYSFGPIPIYGLCIPSNMRHFKAGHGGDGSKNRSTGAQGKDVFIDLPLGTIVKIRRPKQYFLRLLSLNKNLYYWKRKRRLGNWNLSLPPTKLQGMHSQEYQGMD